MNLEERKRFHLRTSSTCTVFRNALLKRPAAFVWSILASGIPTQVDLDKAENYFISFFDSLVPNGFNLKMGGSRGKNSSELNEKISRGMIGKNTWSAGRKQNPETIAKRIQTVKSRGHTNKGRKMTDDDRAKMRA